MSSYADSLATALREAVAATAQSVGIAGRAFTHTVQTVARADDLVDVMRAAVEAVIAADGLHAAADLAVRETRAALAEAMESSGATTITAEHHAAGLSRKPAFLNIADESLIPRDFYVQSAPTLDKRAVLSALKDGTEVPGVSLGVPNAMSLVIRTRKETTP
jgi:hypothetical protein